MKARKVRIVNLLNEIVIYVLPSIYTKAKTVKKQYLLHAKIKR